MQTPTHPADTFVLCCHGSMMEISLLETPHEVLMKVMKGALSHVRSPSDHEWIIFIHPKKLSTSLLCIQCYPGVY